MACCNKKKKSVFVGALILIVLFTLVNSYINSSDSKSKQPAVLSQ